MESKEDIRANMLKAAALIWGHSESEMDTTAFDPLVGLIIEACSVELEKINREIAKSEERILHKLVETLVPDIDVNALPAHAVAHGRSVDPVHYLKPEDLVFTKKKDDLGERDIFFSPLEPYKIIDGDVKYIATDKAVFAIDDNLLRDPAIRATQAQSVNNPTVWLGLELGQKISELREIPFYVNWKNEPKFEQFKRFFSLGRWYLGDIELDVKCKYAKKEQASLVQSRSPFEIAYNPTLRLIRNVERHYQNQFFTVEIPNNFTTHFGAEEHKSRYPKALEQVFGLEALEKIKGKLLWLKIEFPGFFPPDFYNKLDCFTNCFPVVNRKLYTPNKRLREHLNILALEYDNFLFDVEEITNQKGMAYYSSSLANIRKFEGGAYSLRRRGVGRFDAHAASNLLHELIDQLRDETASFAAYDLDFLATTSRKLLQEITRVEQHVLQSKELKENIAYLVVRPFANNDTVTLKYWSTNGGDGNQVPPGANLEAYRFNALKRNTIKLITPSMGGHNELSPEQKKQVYKRALLNRERVVTPEDIKAFCHAQLGADLRRVEIRKGLKIGDLPAQGITRTLEVELLLSNGIAAKSKSNANWITDLEEELNARSSGVLPIVVKTISDEKNQG